jgi:hypothetical protein
MKLFYDIGCCVLCYKSMGKLSRAGVPRGVFFQAAIKVVLSHLNGTFRLTVSPGSPRRCSAPTSMLFCACPVRTIRIMGAFKTHLRRYCGPERTPPGVLRLSSVWQRINNSGLWINDESELAGENLGQ